MLRGRAADVRQPHKLEVVGSTPTPAIRALPTCRRRENAATIYSWCTLLGSDVLQHLPVSSAGIIGLSVPVFCGDKQTACRSD